MTIFNKSDLEGINCNYRAVCFYSEKINLEAEKGETNTCKVE